MSTTFPPFQSSASNFGTPGGGGATIGTPGGVNIQTPTTTRTTPPQSQTPGFSFGNNNNDNNSTENKSGMTSNPLLAAARGPSTTPMGGGSLSSPGGYRRETSGGSNNSGAITTIGANPLLGTSGPPTNTIRPATSTPASSSLYPSSSSRALTTLENAQQQQSNAPSSFMNQNESSSFGMRRRRPGNEAGNNGENEDPNVVRNMAAPPPPKISLGMIASGRYGDEYGGGVARSKGAGFGGSRRELPTSQFSKPSDIDKKIPTSDSTTIQSAYQNNTASEYANWVVIYGIPNPASQHMSLLHRFETYGTILQRHASSDDVSNFVCFKYESPLQAEKALCQHGTFLECSSGRQGGMSNKSGIVIIGVARVDRTMAMKLGLSFGGDDGSIITTDRNANASVLGGGGRASSVLRGGEGATKNTFLMHENDILLFGEDEHYKRREGVCDKLFAWLGGGTVERP